MSYPPPKDPEEIRALRETTDRLREKFPDKVPIVLAPSDSKHDLGLPKKYLVYQDSSLGKFVATVRRRAKLGDSEALFFYVNHSLLPIHQLIAEVYERHKHADGLLYITYAKENTFG